MNRRGSPLFSLLIVPFVYLWQPSTVSCQSRKLTAITDQMPFVGQLYLHIENESNLSKWFSTIEWPETRKRICQDIMSNDYFKVKGLVPQHMNDFYEGQAGAVHEFDLIYRRVRPTDFFPRYVNPYRRLQIRFPAVIDFQTLEYTVNSRFEDLFSCLVNPVNSSEIQSYWISKEYTVSSELSTSPNFARFIFQNSGSFVAMAEEPVVAMVSPDFNVEIEYIRRKQIFITETYSERDPLCALVEVGSIKNEYDRLCMTAMGSSYFEGKFRLHPHPLNVEPCFENQVSFQTEQARAEAGEDVYKEWMIRCIVQDVSSDRVFIYMISRGYEMQEVFVYFFDFVHGCTYLENFSTNANIDDVAQVMMIDIPQNSTIPHFSTNANIDDVAQVMMIDPAELH